MTPGTAFLLVVVAFALGGLVFAPLTAARARHTFARNLAAATIGYDGEPQPVAPEVVADAAVAAVTRRPGLHRPALSTGVVHRLLTAAAGPAPVYMSGPLVPTIPALVPAPRAHTAGGFDDIT